MLNMPIKVNDQEFSMQTGKLCVFCSHIQLSGWQYRVGGALEITKIYFS